MVVRQNTVTSGDQERVDYYANDESIAKSKTGYYDKSKSQTQAKGNAKWLGSLKGETELGLDDEVIQEDFKKICYGVSPKNKELRQKQNQKDVNI
jgi:hypothetical protein